MKADTQILGSFGQIGLRTPSRARCVGVLVGIWLLGLRSWCAAEEGWAAIRQFFQPPPELAGDSKGYKSPLVFGDGRPVKSVQDWAVRRKEIISQWENIIGGVPVPITAPKVEYLSQTNRENFVQHRIRIEIAPGRMEEGYLLVPNGAGRFPGVVVPYYEPASSVGLKEPLRDFGYQLTRRGFVSLCIGSPGGDARAPKTGEVECQPLLFLGYVAANCRNALARMSQVDPARIGVVGHSYGGKWAMFGSCFYEGFACAAWSDPGIVFDEKRPNVNYWEPWYLGFDPVETRKPGLPTTENPRTGAYKKLIAQGHDLHELHVLLAPRPFLVSGGAEDQPERWRALNHSLAVNQLLGFTNRVAMTNRKGHTPTPESNEQIYLFFEHFLGGPGRK